MAKMEVLKTSMINDAWLFQRGKRIEGRVVKVRSGLNVVQRMHKAAGGLNRAEFTIEDVRYKGGTVSGDFFCFPKDSIERLSAMLEESSTDNLSNVVSDFYQTEILLLAQFQFTAHPYN